MQIPDRNEAEKLLLEAEERNPGPWAAHSRNVAEAALRIADRIPEINSESAYILGLLHDIGRWAGVSRLRHMIDGYRLMMEKGYPDAARICLTHTFQYQDIRAMSGDWDGTAEDLDWISHFLKQVTYNDYDRLIQLCDTLSMPDGWCLIEKRMVNVALQYGIREDTLLKWQAIFTLQHSFEARIGQSIYSLLPGVVENTFHTSAMRTAEPDMRNRNL